MNQLSDINVRGLRTDETKPTDLRFSTTQITTLYLNGIHNYFNKINFSN
jgi:hypothetical protein